MDIAISTLLRRLNPFCASALEAAASLCQTRAHKEITLEHWLLKLLEQGEGDITVIARRYEWDLSTIWQALLSTLEQLPHSVQGKPLLAKELQHLLQNAWLQASLQDNAQQIRSLHLLMALTEQPHYLTARDAWPLLSLRPSQLTALSSFLDNCSDERPDNPRRDVAELSTAALPIPTTSATTDNAEQTILDRFTQNITAQARQGKIDPVLGRDNEIRQVIDILTRRRKNNPILVGEPGVGKTALVEGLALRIAQGNVPASLANVALHTLDLGLLQAGAGVKGEFEQRLKNVISAVQQSATPILLFIDEAHTLIGAGNQAGSADAANLLKPALARGELRTLAATTWAEYKQYFERDAALTRRFQLIKVDEPDDEKAVTMLRGLQQRYALHHGVHIQDAAVTAAVTLSRRYLPGRQLPDKAVDLLDTACARVRMSLDTQPERLLQLHSELAALDLQQQAIQQDHALCHNSALTEQLEQLQQRRQACQQRNDQLYQQYQQEKVLAEQLLQCRQQPDNADQCLALQQQLTQLQQQQALVLTEVDVATVANVIADWTGIPLSSLLKHEQAHLLQLEQQLSQQVKGQSAAINQIARSLRAAKTGLSHDQGPLAVFLLLGPSGVGKTQTAYALADQLFAGSRSLVTINLSEYQEAHTVSQLKGSPPGYVGYGQGGILTEAVRQQPYSVVLLDEVEKAHRDVLNLFYQVFDKGMMRDGEGREIDFSNTVIIMTSNLGSQALMQLLDQQPEASQADCHDCLYPILRDHFQPALLARFQVVIYRPLASAALRDIVEQKLHKVAQRLQQHYGIEGTFSQNLYDTLVAACLLPDSGARNIDHLLKEQILPPLSQTLLTLKQQEQQIKQIQIDFTEQDGLQLTYY